MEHLICQDILTGLTKSPVEAFTSLAHLIENGLGKGHRELEVTEQIIQPISYNLNLLSCLKEKADLTLSKREGY